MDSGSSGSMQSSSGGGGGGGGGGGDEEYDSRGESISSFLNHPSSVAGGHFGSISSNPPHPPILSHQQSTLFDLHLHNLDTFPQSLPTPNANFEYNSNMVWPRGLRSESTNYGNFGNYASSSPSSSRSQSLLGTAQGMGQAMRPPLMESTRASPNLDHQQQQQQQQQNVVNKNPKKRTRASRRAPTTVLNTDTTNFRQMVQEFTGIPAAPFSGSSLPFSRRFDLFSGSAMRGAGQLDALGSLYPLRPSAQKAQISPFMAASASSTASPSLLGSGVINAGGTNNAITAAIAGTSNTINSTTNSFQTPSINLGLQKQPQNIFGMQNQLLTFPSSLKLNPMGNEPFFSTRSQGGMNMNMPSSDELGMSHHQQARNDDNNGGPDHHRHHQNQLGSFDHGNGVNAQHVSSFKLNNSSSSSADFYPEKVLENASSGGTEFRNFN